MTFLHGDLDKERCKAQTKTLCVILPSTSSLPTPEESIWPQIDMSTNNFHVISQFFLIGEDLLNSNDKSDG